MKKILLPLFLLFSVLLTLGAALSSQPLIWVSKPFVMPLLALWVWLAEGQQRPDLKFAWVLGLLFSTAGDVLLMFEGGAFFLAGLGAFLLAHLTYIGGIRKGLPDAQGFLGRQPGWLVVFLLYPVAILAYLWAGIPAGMRVPVAVYALVIATMAQSVVNLRDGLPRPIFRSLLAGALLFVASDSLLALNKFGQPFAWAHFGVLSTYLAGQYLLARGIRECLTVPSTR